MINLSYLPAYIKHTSNQVLLAESVILDLFHARHKGDIRNHPIAGLVGAFVISSALCAGSSIAADRYDGQEGVQKTASTLANSTSYMEYRATVDLERRARSEASRGKTAIAYTFVQQALVEADHALQAEQASRADEARANATGTAEDTNTVAAAITGFIGIVSLTGVCISASQKLGGSY